MKKYLLGISVVLLVLSCSEKSVLQENEETFVQNNSVTATNMGVVPGVSIVKFDEEMTQQIESELQAGGKLVTRSVAMSSVMENLGVSKVHRLFPYDERYEGRTRREGLHRWYVLEFDKNQPLTKAQKELSSIPGVDIVESQRNVLPTGYNDPEFSKQWHFYNDGNNGKVKGVDINVKPVWDNFTKGSPNVIVAVIDQGVQLNHKDLVGNAIPGGAHGSKNLFENNYVIDPGNHGCHVAGVISAMNNNGILGSSIAGGDVETGQKGVRIMSIEMLRDVKVGNKVQSESVSAAPGFKWAADNGAVIAQNSWGYPADQNGDGHIDPDELEAAKNFKIPKSLTEAIDYFIKYAGCDDDGNQKPDSPMKGGVVFFAAGNDAIQYGDVCKYEPVIAVGAMDSGGNRSSFSNYGDWVDIAAPGTAIYSCYAKDGFGVMQGTSMACPHASGVAALVLSYRGGPGFTNEHLKECMLKGANPKMVSPNAKIGPMLDALGAITYGLDDYPKQPSFHAVANSNNVDFTWNVTDSPKEIVAYSYMMFAAKDKSLLESITSVQDIPEGVMYAEVLTPEGAVEGQEMKARLTGLNFNADYHVGLLALGYAHAFSGKMNIYSVHTGENHPPIIEYDRENAIKIKSFEYREIKVKITDPDHHRVKVTTDPIDGFISLKSEDDQGNYILAIDGNTFEAGVYQLGIHLVDQYGMKKDEVIEFEVYPNRAPEKLQDFKDYLYNGVGGKFDFVLSDYIVDPDGEDLAVSFDISDRNVLHINYSGGKIYASVLNYGMTNVAITAKDMKGLSITLEFRVLVRQDGVKMEMYPVPMKDVLNIRTGENKGKTDVEILSSTGVVVFNGTGESSAFEPMKIGVSHLAPGQYKVKVTYGGKIEVKSVVKK